MKYNSIENASNFIPEQIRWAKDNGYQNFIIWSNGKELIATLVLPDIANVFQRCDLKKQGYWKAIVFENGNQIDL